MGGRITAVIFVHLLIFISFENLPFAFGRVIGWRPGGAMQETGLLGASIGPPSSNRELIHPRSYSESGLTTRIRPQYTCGPSSCQQLSLFVYPVQLLIFYIYICYKLCLLSNAPAAAYSLPLHFSLTVLRAKFSQPCSLQNRPSHTFSKATFSSSIFPSTSTTASAVAIALLSPVSIAIPLSERFVELTELI